MDKELLVQIVERARNVASNTCTQAEPIVRRARKPKDRTT